MVELCGFDATAVPRSPTGADEADKRRIFATSREHDIHHASREPRNISVMLSICDRMFGTFEKAR